jgi:hypothetical protein
MKRLKVTMVLLSVLAFMNVSSAYSQSNAIFVDDVDINALENLEYVSIIIVGKGIGTKSKVIVDYGQKLNWASLGNPKIRNTKGGEVKSFNGGIDALNFFHLNGWDFVTQTQVELGITSEIGFVFLLRKIRN